MEEVELEEVELEEAGLEETTWAGVRERVLALAEAPGRAAVFGSASHGFRLAEPLTPAELAELEARIGVVLPAEYREFLLRVGAGVAGPAHGLFPVRRVQGRWRWEGDGADLADLSRLAEPFPRQGPDRALVRAVLAERPMEEEYAEIEDFDDAIEAWDERWEEVMYSPDRTVGAVVINHLGCAARQWLVLSGPERGRIWADDRVDDLDLVPLLDEHGAPLTFARWYLAWLEESERQVREQPARPASR
ncbi:SMI1/KNR4 family protein [Kitasatospora sp. LaBMicrA B282]|uniref:SMI1/KNR4 family protein n=1 Tax=Kitasatospora sp. LaBMicrA B282 TaxID=3420949 RepID=UPI003D0C2091